MTSVASTAKQATSTMNAIINTGGTLVRLLGWLSNPTPIAAASVKEPANPVNVQPAFRKRPQTVPLAGGSSMSDFTDMPVYDYDVDNMVFIHEL